MTCCPTGTKRTASRTNSTNSKPVSDKGRTNETEDSGSNGMDGFAVKGSAVGGSKADDSDDVDKVENR